MQYFLALGSALKPAPFFSYYSPWEHKEKFSINVECHIFRTEQSELWYQAAIIAYQHPNGEADSVLEKHGKLTFIPKKWAQLEAGVKKKKVGIQS